MVSLVLSWSVTIHKTQGWTLEKAIINLNGCFTSAIEYVALSCIKISRGLALTGLVLISGYI
jgi:hypothetical protein